MLLEFQFVCWIHLLKKEIYVNKAPSDYVDVRTFIPI